MCVVLVHLLSLYIKLIVYEQVNSMNVTLALSAGLLMSVSLDYGTSCDHQYLARLSDNMPAVNY